MGRTNYKCPECNRWTGMNGAYRDGSKSHRCKFCGCRVSVKIKGAFQWKADWMSIAVKEKE